MTAPLAVLLAATLIAIAAIHVYWGAGGVWPGRDEPSLARMVIGSPGITRMPSPAACNIVGALLVGIALWPLAKTGVLPAMAPAWLMTLAGWTIAGVFLARGFIAYVPAFRRLAPEEPFATLDRKLYAPLCIALGLGFLAFLT